MEDEIEQANSPYRGQATYRQRDLFIRDCRRKTCAGFVPGTCKEPGILMCGAQNARLWLCRKCVQKAERYEEHLRSTSMAESSRTISPESRRAQALKQLGPKSLTMRLAIERRKLPKNLDSLYRKETC